MWWQPAKWPPPSFGIAAGKITIFAGPPRLLRGVRGYGGAVGLENGASIAPFVAPGRGATVTDGCATGKPPLNSGASLPPTQIPPGYAKLTQHKFGNAEKFVRRKFACHGGFPGPLSPHPTPHPSSADRRAQGWYVPRPHDRARKKGRADWVSHFPQARRTCVVRLLRTSADSSCSAHNNQFVSMFWDLGRPFRLPL